MNNVKKSLIFITALCSISQLYPILGTTTDSKPPVSPSSAKVIGGNSGKLGKGGYQNVPGGQGRGIYHGNSGITVPKVLGSLELTGPNRQPGRYFPGLKVAFYTDKLGNTTYMLNVTPIIPVTLSPEAQAKFTPNAATVTLNGKQVPLHAIVLTPAVTTTIKTGYNNLLNLIPDLMGAAALVDLQSLNNLYTAFKTLLPAQPVDVVA